MPTDVFGAALLDYHLGRQPEDIKTYSSLDEEDVLPVSYLFRDYKDMPPLEKAALAACKGTVLDIGCGAGSHSLQLQGSGHEVTALDTSEGAVIVCRERGLKNVVHADFWTYSGKTYDTLLFLMNGIGLVGKLAHLHSFFERLPLLLNPGGQVLFDSSDILYMFEETADGGYLVPDEADYYGEVTFVMKYKTLESAPFNWLYVDFNTIKRAAHYHGFQCELIRKGPHYDYLAKLTLGT